MPLLNSRLGVVALGVFASVSLLSWQMSFAGPIRDWLKEHQVSHQQEDVSERSTSSQVTLPAGVRLVRDVSYGTDEQQRMDVYLPQQATGVPVIFMVHGGGWRRGDKGANTVVENKMARWVPKGFIFISVNYRLLPKASPLEQAQDITNSLAAAQGKAATWGGDPAKFILMGHSAGAHLVALLGASPAMALKSGARPWLGTISLDSAVLDVVQLMEAKHYPLYDHAFGNDPAYWKKASPFQTLSANATPFLLVCSSRRSDSCPQAHQFAAKTASLNVRASVLEQDLSHKDINQQLGSVGSYTNAVESFMATLDESVMRLLADHSSETR
jgi:arylformamidase